jgi:mono/diheme cytochrome c family protein
MKTLFRLIIGAFLLLVFAGCSGLSLAADVTPPPDFHPTQVPPQAVQTSNAFPLLPPDPLQGAATYSTKCLPCHGATGMGDGFQAGNLPAPPPAIGTAEIAGGARPAEWFDLVTNGRLDKFMPGFSESLNERQRWDVVAYVLSLSLDPAGLEKGKVVYDQQCASCHGDKGQGSASAPDWSRQDRLAVLSLQEMETLVANGKGDMPAYADKLSTEERLAVVDYVRSLSFASSSSQSAQTTPEGTPVGQPTPAATNPDVTPSEVAPRPISIRGTITSSSGGSVPEGLKVTLLGFEGMNQVVETSTSSAADGSYEFKNVELKTGMAFMVRVDKDTYTFNSQILHAADVTGDTAELAVTIFDTTSDTAGLQVDRLHVFFDFTTAGKVQVVELFIITNQGGKVVVPAAVDKPVLNFTLPQGAANLQFDGDPNGTRFLTTANGFGDLSPVQPDPEQHQVLFSYDLPYDKKLALDIPVPLNTGAAVVMLPPGSVKMQSDQLSAAGSRDVQGMTFQMYTASNLAAGGSLKINLSGKANATASTDGNNLNGLFIGLGAFGVVLAGAGLWLFRQRQGSRNEDTGVEPVAEESEDSLLDAILALDDLYKAGKLPEDAYQQRRAELKDRLKLIHGSK